MTIFSFFSLLPVYRFKNVFIVTADSLMYTYKVVFRPLH